MKGWSFSGSVVRKGISATGSIDAAMKKRRWPFLVYEREWLHMRHTLSMQWVRMTFGIQPLKEVIAKKQQPKHGLNTTLFHKQKPQKLDRDLEVT